MRFIPLHLKMLVLTCSLLAATLGTLTLVLSEQQAAATRAMLSDQGMAVAKSIEAAAASKLVMYDSFSLQNMANDLATGTGIVYVIIHDKEHRVAAYSNRPDAIYKPSADLIAEKAVASGEPLVQKYSYQGNIPCLDISVPVYLNDPRERWGTIRLGLSLRMVEDQAARTMTTILVLGSIALAIGIAASMVMAKMITKPISRLTEFSVKVGQGNYGSAFTVRSNDEVGILADNFERMIAEVRIREDKIRHNERLAAIGVLSASLAHDIRNPLSVIKTLASRISKGGAEDGHLEHMGQRASSAVRRIETIIDSLLDLTRPVQYDFTSVDAQELVTQLLELYSDVLTEKGISWEVRQETVTPPIRVDEDQLSKAFLNIVRNASQAMDGGGKLSVSIGPLPAPAEAVGITIADTGPGLSAEYIDKIFDPFFTTKGSGQGTGLGLAICQKILLDHGGSVSASNLPGGGAAFTLTLPAAG